MTVKDDAELTFNDWRRHPLGIRHARSLGIADAEPAITWRQSKLVDYGPFYLRWLADFAIGAAGRRFHRTLEAARLHILGSTG